MSDHSPDRWPAPTPRQEMLERVVARGTRLRRIRIGLAALAVATVVALAVGGFALGRSGAVDVVAEKQVAVPDALLPYSSCPGLAPIGDLHRGDRVFLTGRDASGGWAEIRSPQVPDGRVWVRHDMLAVDTDVDLPVRTCIDPATGRLAPAPTEPGQTTTTVPGRSTSTSTTTPGATTTAPQATTPPGSTTVPGDPDPTPTTRPTTPTTRPTTPTTRPPTPTTRPVPRPTVGPLTRSQATMGEDWPGVCSSLPLTSTISAPVSGATTVELSWNVGPEPRRTDMVVTGGVARGVLGPFDQDTVPGPGGSLPITVRVTATGPGGTTSRTTTPTTHVTLNDCEFG